MKTLSSDRKLKHPPFPLVLEAFAFAIVAPALTLAIGASLFVMMGGMFHGYEGQSVLTTLQNAVDGFEFNQIDDFVIFGISLIAALIFAVLFGGGFIAFTIGIVATVVVTLHVLFLAAPSYFALRRLGWINSWTIILLGFVVGAVPFTLNSWVSSNSVNLGNTILFGFYGAISGSLFYMYPSIRHWMKLRLRKKNVLKA